MHLPHERSKACKPSAQVMPKGTGCAEEIRSLTALFKAEQAKHAAQCSALQDKLLAAEQQQHSLQTALQASTSQAFASQQEAQQSKQALATSQASQQELSNSLAGVQERCKTLEQNLSSAQGSLAQNQGNKAVGVIPNGVLQLLEQQLISLSQQLKSKEEQVAALQQTVKQQCDERTMLQIKCIQLETASTSASSSTTASSTVKQAKAADNHTGRGPMGVEKASSDSASDALILGSKSSEKAGSALPGKAKLSRLASASEQQHGKSGLLGRIMATSSTTGKISC